MENVIWKDIKDYEGMYQVSNTGLVRSLDRYTPDKGGLRLQKGKILKNQIDLKGNKIATYDSISYAHRVTGACNISSCLTNERKTSGGYRWEYASEEDMKEMFRKRLFDFIGEPK